MKMSLQRILELWDIIEGFVAVLYSVLVSFMHLDNINILFEKGTTTKSILHPQ
jgi:hypothetical protein